MFSRRAFLSVIGGSIVMPNLSLAQTTGQKVALYANVGPDLIHYDVDVAGAELIKRETMTVTGGIQYAWPHRGVTFIGEQQRRARLCQRAADPSFSHGAGARPEVRSANQAW